MGSSQEEELDSTATASRSQEGQGHENQAFDDDDDDKAPPPNLVSSLVPPPPNSNNKLEVSLPLYEISLNGNSLKRDSLEKNAKNYVNDADTEDGHPKDNYNDHDDDEMDMRCGLGCFSPEWIQSYATKKTFLVIFSMLGVIQGMTWSYFTATITTLEKRFKISSQTAGVVMTGNEISQILFSLFIAYFGGKGHRPRWISVGVLFSALACFVLASPQFFYGSGDDMLALTEEYGYLYDQDQGQGYPDAIAIRQGLREMASSTENDILSSTTTRSTTPASSLSSVIGKLASKRGRVSVCMPTPSGKPSQTGSRSCTSSEFDSISSFAPLIIIFLSQFVAGIGNLLFFSLGGPYLDDNTSRNNMPRVMGATMSLRLIGPMLGFMISFGTLKLFVNPFLTPIIAQDDPRWQGAWWLGWVIFGTAMMIMSVFIALFPRRLRRKNQKSVDPKKINSPEAIPKISEIPGAVKTLLKNKVNLFNNLAGVFYLFSAIGYWTYMPKYLETIFMQTASNASIISGAVGILFQSTGMMISGILISKWQPSARKLASWNVIIAWIAVLTMVSFTQLGCDVGNVDFGVKNRIDGTWNLTTECNYDCNCKTSKILPVCDKETNTVYYSACHAGCSVYENGRISDCKCVNGGVEGIGGYPSVKLGNCSEGCSGIFILFLGITAMIKFFDATGRIGNMLISYRCVELKDRSLGIGLNILMMSLLAFLPSPILFGRIIDNVCLVWGGSSSSCGGGKSGNCMLYDGERLRYIFNLTAAGFTLVGGLLDCLVLYYVKDMELYKEPDEDGGQEKKRSIKDVNYDSTSFMKNNNKEKEVNGGGGGGAKEVGGGGGFVNLCFNNEKSEK